MNIDDPMKVKNRYYSQIKKKDQFDELLKEGKENQGLFDGASSEEKDDDKSHSHNNCDVEDLSFLDIENKETHNVEYSQCQSLSHQEEGIPATSYFFPTNEPESAFAQNEFDCFVE
mmetsp:Transcript_13556/g.11618  ORF Transcript_13556/g.11618 Transcript_13556/m.11618 type:complete len:116 (-) Transcript_13556:50-397(-)